MNITTKYNIGQKLWILVSKSSTFKAVKVTITSIGAEVIGSSQKMDSGWPIIAGILMELSLVDCDSFFM